MPVSTFNACHDGLAGWRTIHDAAAWRLFEVQGCEAPTVAPIVETAHASRATFVNFGVKEDVVFDPDAEERAAWQASTVARPR